ncbi:HAMP domain-containing histidine kinase [Planococcus sp. ANT_H30]|uniref:histidine kinase n=1 Tax=Planococcus kocurii TaxID=1374 RepID=A0ABM5WSR6_9BACL|nr:MULTISPECIES: HAMP domain-containing sensor histidine kinase [Planococcus]ALS77285.1 histidine kinase [Planococcus kocurii]KAA0956190.1 HAMP domain-containing histidine kinase [Planococcus sp. ANT_H30]
MNLYKRFMVQFFIQLFLLSLIFLVGMLIVWAVIGFTISEDEIQTDLAEADASYFTNRIILDDNNHFFKKNLEELAESQNGWLILLDSDGAILDSFNAPEVLPTQFTVSDFTDRLWGSLEDNQQFTYWEIEFLDMAPLLLLYGRNNMAEDLLESAVPVIDWQQENLNLTLGTKEELEKEKAWIQLLSPEGKVLDTYGEVSESSLYTMQQLGELQSENQWLASLTNTETGLTVVTGLKNVPSTAWGTTFSNQNLFLFALTTLILLAIGTFWYARKFGAPLLVMMQWIQNLGNGQYEEPTNENKGSLITNKKGKIKKKYRLYKDLIDTLEQLTATLKIHQHQQKTLERTREDWISGLSHDLKTPLSSISGYAQMLESSDYEWSAKETREFASIMNEKSFYMMELLEELTLTFRLKNQALPLAKEQIDINEFIRRIVIHFINDPSNTELKFTFVAAPQSIRVNIDPMWFQRIIDNLIANAVKYNPSGTEIKISVSTIEQHLFVVLIEDDGKGMEMEIMEKLFDRYYRGTNTHDTSTGTGLGLAITKQLIQLHDGSIHVESMPEKGTAVRVIVPV